MMKRSRPRVHSSTDEEEVKKRPCAPLGADGGGDLMAALLGATDPVAPPSRSSKPLPSVEELEAGMREQPSAALGVRILEQTRVVERIAGGSRNLQGALVRGLRLAARNVQAAAGVLERRGCATSQAAENDRLRARVAGLEEEVRAIAAELASLRAAPARPRSPPSSVRVERGEDSRRLPSSLGAGSSSAGSAGAAGRGGISAFPPLPAPAGLVRRAAVAASPPLVPSGNRGGGRGVDGSAPSGPRGLGAGGLADADKLLSRVGEIIGAGLMGLRRELAPGGVANRGAAVATRSSAPAEGTWAQVVGRSARKRAAAAGGGGGMAVPPPPTGARPRPSGARARGAPGRSPSHCDLRDLVRGSERRGGDIPPRLTPSQKRNARRRRAREALRAAAAVPGAGGMDARASVALPRASAPPPRRALFVLGRPPKTAAVTLTVPEGGALTYAAAMAVAREKISLSDMGIAAVRPRRAVTGGLILEIPGPEGAARAEALAAGLRQALEGTGVRVARPTKSAELRVRGLDDSVRPEEVASAIATAGGCSVGEVRTGDIRSSPAGLGTAWVRCPLEAARRVIAGGRITVGWTSARVEALPPRRLQCYRCLESGHVGRACTSPVDRTGACYRCGEAGHRAAACSATPRCTVCAGQGRPADHRIGGRGCRPVPAARGRRAAVPAVPRGTVALPSAEEVAASQSGAVELPPPSADVCEAIGGAMEIAP